MTREAFVVVDLGFGDSGKGLVTDYLTRAHAARTVVRFNGGAQAGHNVVTDDGRHHTFSQLGAGTFAGDVVTFLSRSFVVHPTAMWIEAEALARKGVPHALERVWIDGEALVTTPFHQALNRIRELARGRARHGTCGVGFGETVRDSHVAGEDALRARDVARPAVLHRKLARALERASSEAARVIDGIATTASIDAELRMLAPGIARAWAERAAAWVEHVRIVGPDALADRAHGAVVFEGAQGVLLDERFGFRPHCTFSKCTPANALELAREQLPDHRLTCLGVLRTYLTRHGAGPFPTEDAELSPSSEPHNTDEGWQGAFRVGWPDFVLLDHAVRSCEKLDGLAVTHVDALARAERWRWCDRYEPAPRALTSEIVADARPVYRECATADFVDVVTDRLGLRVALTSGGPRASDVRPHMDGHDSWPLIQDIRRTRRPARGGARRPS